MKHFKVTGRGFSESCHSENCLFFECRLRDALYKIIIIGPPVRLSAVVFPSTLLLLQQVLYLYFSLYSQAKGN